MGNFNQSKLGEKSLNCCGLECSFGAFVALQRASSFEEKGCEFINSKDVEKVCCFAGTSELADCSCGNIPLGELLKYISPISSLGACSFSVLCECTFCFQCANFLIAIKLFIILAVACSSPQ